MELKRKQSARSAVTQSRSKCQKYSLHIFSGLLFSVFSTLAAAALDRVGDLALLDDDGQLISETLNIVNAGDVLVLNPQRLTLCFKGQPSQELESVLDSITAEGVSDTIRQSGAGCAIGHSESARYLDPSNLQTLVCWINSRTPRGDSAV